MAEVLLSNLKSFGLTFKLWLMDRPTLITADPKLVKLLLTSNKHLEKHDSYTYSAKILQGNGLVTSDVDQWKSDRKFLNPFFNLEYFTSSFKQCVDNWPTLEKFIDSRENKPWNCQKNFSKHFIAILLKSFSCDASLTTEKSLCEIEKQFTIGLDILNARIQKPWTRIPIYWKLSGYERKLQKYHEDFRSLVAKIMDGCKMNNNLEVPTEHDSDDKAADDNAATRAPKTFKQLFADTSKSWEWKYDHMITIIAGGVDTVSIVTTMALFFLALNPECQKKAQEETDSIFSENEHEALNFQDISKMKYLRMCIKEAMRLHPPAPLVGRTTTEDISMDGRKIPKGTSILILLQGLGLNPDYFLQPLRFDPERFNDSNPSIISYTYIPFSIGPRNCIGQRYAESILPPMLALILRKYNVTTEQTAEDIKILYEVAGTPFPEVQLIFNPRS